MRKSVTFRQLFLVICGTGGGCFPCSSANRAWLRLLHRPLSRHIVEEAVPVNKALSLVVIFAIAIIGELLVAVTRLVAHDRQAPERNNE
jgi:hypothetical protein